MKINFKYFISKALEYLKLIPKGIPNIRSIIEGIVNNLELKCTKLAKEEKSEIIKRRIICTGCPFNNINTQTSNEYFNLNKQHYISKRNDSHCSFCGCPTNIRTAALSANCGIEIWNDQNPNKSIDLKWTSYGK